MATYNQTGADDDVLSFRAFECGYWFWNDLEECLQFKSDAVPMEESKIALAPRLLTQSAYAFRDIDVVEQLKFKKRYQRKLKPNEPDIMTLQDVKDLALYMAPLAMQSESLINILHSSTAEKFLRALILYCHYFIQIGQEMAERVKALENKIRTPRSDEIEATYRRNLSDLRCLVAKEYTNIVCGNKEMRHFHHMGKRKQKSLSEKDARFFEMFIQMSTQIVWLALGRRSFNQLELEINRMMKTGIFNSVEHRLQTGYLSKMTSLERDVLIGQCAQSDHKLVTRSPLLNDLFCKNKTVDYKLMGLSVIKYDHLSPRYRYFRRAIASPEEKLYTWGVTVGILGLPRSNFDTALHFIDTSATETDKNSSQSSTGSRSSANVAAKMQSRSRRSLTLSRQSRMSEKRDESSQSTYNSLRLYGYPDLNLPSDDLDEVDSFPLTFPDDDDDDKVRNCSMEQRMQWLNRYKSLMNPKFSVRVGQSYAPLD